MSVPGAGGGNESGGRERRAQAGCGRRVAYKTAGAVAGPGKRRGRLFLGSWPRGLVAATWRRVRAYCLRARVSLVRCRLPVAVEMWTGVAEGHFCTYSRVR